METVAAVKADSYDPHIVGQAITEMLAHLGGISQFIQPGDRVLVKPNMLEAVNKLFAHIVRSYILKIQGDNGRFKGDFKKN